MPTEFRNCFIEACAATLRNGRGSLGRVGKDSAGDRRLKTFPDRYKTQVLLLLLTLVALLVQGYHPFVEDAEIYLPGVEKILNPKLFPVGGEFFLAHARMTLFPNVLAFFLRVTHLPLTAGLFLWQIISIYLLLLACWQLAAQFFPGARARWGAVCLVAALLTIPVAGTALYIMDQYVNPRNLAAFAGIFALASLLEKKHLRAFLWLAFAASMHPMMWVFPTSFCILFLVMERLGGWWKKTRVEVAGVLAATFGIGLAPGTSEAYHRAALRHAFHYIQHWTWYELLGAVAPLFLFWWFGVIARRREWRKLECLGRTFVVYGLIYLGMALVFDLPASFEALARLQPLRSLHFLYIVMFLVIGGLLGEYVLKERAWRWALLFVPLSAGMFMAQRSLFPADAHVELPGVTPRNPWAQTFLWIRYNTPIDAVFALDPYYLHIAGEDDIGFRCLAQRSRLADGVKDNGVVSMFPLLAEEWWGQVKDQLPWKDLKAADFSRLEGKYGVSWVVLQQESADSSLDCPYRNGTIHVCRVP